MKHTTHGECRRVARAGYPLGLCLALWLLAGLPCRGQAASAKIPASRVVMAEMSRKGLSAGLSRYASLHNAGAGGYECNAEQLTLVADSLIGKNRVPDAVEVLRANVKLYPDAPAAHAALGHAYALNGDNALALGAYEKTLALGGGDEKVKQNLRLLKNADGATRYYVCAPCACASHHLEFIAKGKCPACAMDLVEKKANAK